MRLTASLGLLITAIVQAPSLIDAAAIASDPCAIIAGKSFVTPSKAMACLKSFPYNEAIKTNVMSNAERVMDFFTFEPFYKDSPSPFQESTVQIREEFSRIRNTKYDSDYAFNRDLFDISLSLNDGHTRWFPACYITFQNLLPTPIISLAEGGEYNIHVAPDAVEFVSLLGDKFTSYYDELGFDWKRLAGAKIVEVEGKSPYDYVDYLASTQAGNYLDHGIRVNSVFTGYRIVGSDWSQKFGIFAGRQFPDKDCLTMSVIPVGSQEVEEVQVPFYANYLGAPFTDRASYWNANCAVKNTTNGVNYLEGVSASRTAKRKKLQPVAEINQDSTPTRASAVGLPQQYVPTAPSVAGSTGAVKSYILPDGKTGAMYVSTFKPSNFEQFQRDVESAMKEFTSKGVTKLIVDLHNNGGGYVCLASFLFSFLAGKGAGYPGFDSTIRANELSKKIVASNIKLGLNSSWTYFAPDNWVFPDGTIQPSNYNYVDPSAPFSVNGISDPTSQRFHDTCQSSFSVQIPDTPAFKPGNIALVGNGNCASSCALFSTLMFEKLGTKIAVFGGRPGQNIEFKGMAGNQVLDWPLLDSEIKTARLKDDPLAPPDLIVDGNYRVNWRTAWSWIKEDEPIAYLAEPPQFRFGYTNETYNNPQNLWIYSAARLFLPV